MNGLDAGELLLAAGDAAGVVATALVLFAVALAARRHHRGLAETCALWGLGFGAAHVVLGALGGDGGLGPAALLGAVAAVAVLAAAAAGWWRVDEPPSRDRPRGSGQIAQPQAPVAPRAPGPVPSRLWSSGP